uniref:Uncharacterized protein n=1 Tax=Mus musculus TaxID=10090 RepID=Q3U256_MOUSE|nr:unnamed protein product [Mus musculus]
MLGRACRCLTKPSGEPADAEATCLSLDRRLELLILPNEPYQLLQFLIFPHQPLYLMPKPLVTLTLPLHLISAPWVLESSGVSFSQESKMKT